MTDPASYRPAPGSIPAAPGVYRFRDPHGRVVYVGKAKSLRSRVSSYFADLSTLHPRTRQMVTTAASVEWTVVGTEVEALQLEYSWIKEFDPRFNIRYRDDKSYPCLAVTVSEEYPRLAVVRGPRKPGVRYFGPYAHAWAIRETLDALLRVFPARTCSNGVLRRHQQLGRPCLLGYLDKCSAPCVGRVDEAAHRAIVADFCDFMAGRTTPVVRRLEQEMLQAAEALEFERAARLRDDLGAVQRALEKQAVVLADGTDADVVGVAEDELEAAVQVFHVRGGRVRGQRGYVVDKVEALTTGELVGQFLTGAYAGAPHDDDGPAVERRMVPGAGVDVSAATDDVPREILVPELPPDTEALTAWLSGVRGRAVVLRTPRRGDKRALMETVQRNAQQALAAHKTRRASDLTARSAALAALQDGLGLDEAPLRIECFDVSHLQGTDVVASMVVFEDGLPRPSEYRRFTVREGGDDTAAMREVLRRRLTRLLQAEQPGEGEAPTAARFAYRPQLLVVDGGAPQVAAAATVLDELGVTDVALCGLAKRLEEVWLPDQEHPLVLPRTSEALYLLQRVRDEAHRFAITFHRQKRSRSMVGSALDDVPGLGDKRRAALLRHFGSLARLKAASVEEVTAVPGVGRRTAEAVLTALGADPAGDPPVPSFDPATGEVLP